MKRLALLFITALALAPAVWASEAGAPEVLALDPDICEVPAATSAVAVPDGQPAAGSDDAFVEALRLQGSGEVCCRAQRLRCEAQCLRTGVFEFSCNPETCPRGVSCICNIG